MFVLISGSRSLHSHHVKKYIKALVARCKELGATVLVGDAPGVDTHVMNACDHLKVPVIIHHISSMPRNTIPGAQHLRVQYTYTQRDEYMVNSADVVMCVWDGNSRGTEHVYRYAQRNGKRAFIRKATR